MAAEFCADSTHITLEVIIQTTASSDTKSRVLKILESTALVNDKVQRGSSYSRLLAATDRYVNHEID